MLRLIFRGHWLVQIIFAVAAFAAAAFFYSAAQKSEAEKALARAQGMPAAVSLSAFDPAKDVHPADEVHVTGWINSDYNYQLTEERRKRSDIVRRMFVLFGPEDAADSKQVRAVVLMPEGDVDRFVEMVVSNTNGFVGLNPVFALNGTGKRYGDLDHMADEALAEKGLTKAPGFRYLEIWPEGGRDAGLAASHDTGLIIAGPLAGFGLLLLIIGVVRFRRRSSAVLPPVQMPQPVFAAATSGQSAMQASVLAPEAPAKKSSIPPAHSYAFLGMAIAIGIAASWTGLWQATLLAFAMVGIHFIARVKKAMDKGVQTVATALTEAKAAVAQDYASLKPANDGVVTRVASPVERIAAVGKTRTVGKLAQVTAVLALLFAGSYFLDGNTLGQLGMPNFVTLSGKDATPPAAEAPAVDAAKVESAASPVAALSPAVEAAEQPVPVAEVSLIPKAASLRPAPGTVAAAPAPEPEPQPAAVVAEVATPAPQPVATPMAPADPEAAPSASLLASVLAGFGNLALLGPIAGASVLAVAAFALMRGRQAASPAVFAGRDPWEKLARSAKART